LEFEDNFSKVQKRPNDLIITTHSPYILNYLTLAMKGGEVLESIRNKKTTDVLKFEVQLGKIVPITACISHKDVCVYQLDTDGSILPLGQENGVMSDDNFLNNSLAETNQLFDALLEIEESLL